MKTFNITVSYFGTAETWDEIRNDAENEKIKDVFIGKKEFVNVVRCKDCKWFGDLGCAIRIVDDSDKPTENDYCSFAERRSE